MTFLKKFVSRKLFALVLAVYLQHVGLLDSNMMIIIGVYLGAQGGVDLLQAKKG